MNEEIREVVRNMILEGDIRLEIVDKQVFSNEGAYIGDEEILVMSVNWEKQDTYDGVKLNHV